MIHNVWFVSFILDQWVCCCCCLCVYWFACVAVHAICRIFKCTFGHCTFWYRYTYYIHRYTSILLASSYLSLCLFSSLIHSRTLTTPKLPHLIICIVSVSRLLQCSVNWVNAFCVPHYYNVCMRFLCFFFSLQVCSFLPFICIEYMILDELVNVHVQMRACLLAQISDKIFF